MTPTAKLRWKMVYVGDKPINSPYSESTQKHQIGVLQQWWAVFREGQETPEGKWMDIPSVYEDDE